MKKWNRKLLLEDGSQYYGYGFGSEEEKITELVFNTAPVGYQEILSDPSYTYQTVVMAYPLIGNYGIAEEDFETKHLSIGGFVVRDYNDLPSNFRSITTLDAVMKQYHIPGIFGIDTRKLVRKIRDFGSCKVLITDAETSSEEGLKKLAEFEIPRDAVERVSSKEIRYHAAKQEKYLVAAIDCGMKENIIRSLNARGCSVMVYPWNVSYEEIQKQKPDGVFLSNGPGDPTDVKPVLKVVRELKGSYPMFGICLGHQILALAYGAKTYKMKFGHRGGNHPVKNLKTGKIEITSQNHSYAVEFDSLKNTDLEMTHINLLDHTVEGIACKKDQVFSVQYHPESAPGPQDSGYLFDQFIQMMEENKHGKAN
jgi:carbamoyl-phosphate synthase small subunit